MCFLQIYIRILRYSVVSLVYFQKIQIIIFLPAGGGCWDTTLGNAGFSGDYWSTNRNTTDHIWAFDFTYKSVDMYPDYNTRNWGYSIHSIRPLKF